MMLLSKKENELTKEELLKVEIMKTMAQAKGYSLDAEGQDLDFRDGSRFEKIARSLMANFEISSKSKKIEKKPEIDNPEFIKNETLPVKKKKILKKAK